MGLTIFLITFISFIVLLHKSKAKKAEQIDRQQQEPPKYSPPHFGAHGYIPTKPIREVIQDDGHGFRVTKETPGENRPTRIEGNTLYMPDGRIIHRPGKTMFLRIRDNYTAEGWYQIKVDPLGLSLEASSMDYWHIEKEMICSQAFVYIHSLHDPESLRTWSGRDVAQQLGGRYLQW